ncbi:4855_t:CDS:10 [Diversispora eburnea]|uniref:4855_t:CDS:1 n=2 Tax=Diversisporales TaxID=214509 RepID=A0A9N9AGF3_9GLOM|nr:4855_t:CDS:10 [Diversispora eburnea]CAG8642812.1 2950_t:CDS:10 [Dentiscutata erythropus]
MSKNKDHKKSILTSTLAGTGAGFDYAGLLPTDVLKTRYQSIRVSSNYQDVGILKSFRKIISQEGLFALYRGTLPVMCIVTPRVSLQYTGLAMFKPLFDQIEGVLIPPGSSSAFTGICTGIMQAITLVTPLELVKIRQQTDLNKQKYSGMISTIVSIVKEEGLLAFYNGLLPTIFRQSWGLAFTGYNTFKDLFSVVNNNQPLSPWQHAISGFSANILVGILNSPPDVVKTRMQDQNVGYKNSWECVKAMLKNEGIKSFFKGATLRCIRIAPGGAIQFSTYEYLNKMISESIKV